MAKAVVTLEGDSSSLVKSIDDAKGAMTKLEAGGRKLTDQLRDVADEADKAAGSLVNKIGGPTAIKAIAGIGAAFAAAQTALGAFSGSMQAFAATQGAAGQKAMARLDTALNELQGSLYEAVTGGASLSDSTDVLVSALASLKTAIDVVLFPFQQFVRLAAEAATNGTLAAKSTKQMAIAEGEYNASLANAKKAMADNAAGIAEIHKQYLSVFGTRKDMAVFEAGEDIRKYVAAKRELEAGALRIKMQQDVMAAARGEAEQRQKERVKYIADILAKYPNIRQETVEGMADAFVESNEEALARIDESRSKALARSAQSGTRDILAQTGALAYYEELGQLIGNAVEKKKILQATAPAAFEPTNTPTGGGGRETAAQKAKREAEEAAAAKAAADAAAQAAALASVGSDPAYIAMQLDQKRFIEKEAQLKEEDQQAKAFAAARLAEFGAASSAEVSSYLDAKTNKAIADQEEFDAARQRAIELHDLTFNFQQTAAEFADAQRAKEKAAHDEKVSELTAGFQEYGKLAGQQLADGEKAAKVAEKLAKKAIGGQISALGDQAMVKAAAFAAELNPMAIPMAAAGVAAYSAAAYLGAEGKKATSATPAAAAPAAAPVNTSFNLRVDAAFADGESIARQFAMMQRSAQRRGLVPVGA